VQVVTIEERITNPHHWDLGIAPQVLTVGVAYKEVYRFSEQETANALAIRLIKWRAHARLTAFPYFALISETNIF
jgi:hypothetical protein